MADNQARLKYLYSRFINDTASADEVREFWKLLAATPDNDAIRDEVFALYNDQIPAEIIEKDWNQARNRILGKANEIPVVPVSRRYWRWTAAAAILLMLTVSAYLLFNTTNKNEPVAEIAAHTDVAAPDVNRAMVTLANGQKIYLDSAANGNLATQDNSTLVKLANGQIVYRAEATAMAGETRYNTLTNPRGSNIINIMLADGSQVWLNAGSSLTYPVVFSGHERKVSITGEAYFEVAHDKTKPFKVSKGSMTVEVLGTHFNVNAYDDEPDIKVTLLEGKVKVESAVGNRQSAILKPGEQAIYSRLTIDDSRLTTHYSPDMDAVMSWKNGRFQFAEADLQTILRQASRWYNVDIEYKGEVRESFSGAIPRNVNASQLFKILESTGKVKITIQDRKIIVQPSLK